MNKKLVTFGLMLLFLAVSFSGCSDLDLRNVDEGNQFSITAFNVEPSLIEQGQTANLSWTVMSAQSVTIDQGIGNIGTMGNRIIQPTETTTYILTAFNGPKTLNATTQIIVKTSNDMEQDNTTGKTFENIDFKSDIVELNSANLEFIKEDEEEFDADSVELHYRLHNPINRYVAVSVDVAFYDGNGREIYSEEGYTINLPDGYTERGMNTVSYSGSMVNAIETAKINAVEVEK